MAQEHQEYIQTKVNPILESLVTQILLERPDNPVPFMIKWLSDQSKTPMPKMANESGETEELKKELASLKAAVQDLEVRSGVANQGGGASAADDEEEEDEDNDDDVVEDMPPPSSYQKGPRSSVSAEAYGAWNQKKEFTPKVVAKSDDQKSRIKQVLCRSFLFMALEEKDLNIVVDAMVEVKVSTGTRIIKEGEDGEVLFVIESGTLDCYKVIGGEEKMVRHVRRVTRLASLRCCTIVHERRPCKPETMLFSGSSTVIPSITSSKMPRRRSATSTKSS